MTPHPLRYRAVSRRAFLRRLVLAGAGAVLGGFATACNNDSTVFAAVATTTTLETTTTTLPPTTTTTTAPQPLALFPRGGELVVAFSYVVSPKAYRPIRSPYVAVWIENEAGQLVTTLALWRRLKGPGTRWLSSLKRWDEVDGSSRSINTISSATRRPGDYTVVWDGTDRAGEPQEQGNYFVCIESSREQGPYSLIREPITVGTSQFWAELPSDFELVNASVELRLA